MMEHLMLRFGEIIYSLSPRLRWERAGVRGDGKIRHHIYEIVNQGPLLAQAVVLHNATSCLGLSSARPHSCTVIRQPLGPTLKEPGPAADRKFPCRGRR